VTHDEVLAELLNVAATLARHQGFAGGDVDRVSEATLERQSWLARRLVRVRNELQAGRPVPRTGRVNTEDS
jgi:hypothetical protein